MELIMHWRLDIRHSIKLRLISWKKQVAFPLSFLNPLKMQLTCIFSVQDSNLIFHEKNFNSVLTRSSKKIQQFSIILLIGNENTGKTTLVNYMMFDFIQNHKSIFTDHDKNGVWISDIIGIIHSHEDIGIFLVDVAGSIYCNHKLFGPFIHFLMSISSVVMINVFQSDFTKQIITDIESNPNRDKLRVILRDYERSKEPVTGYKFSDGLHVNTFAIPAAGDANIDPSCTTGDFRSSVQDIYFHLMKSFNIKRNTFSKKELKEKVLSFLKRYPVMRIDRHGKLQDHIVHSTLTCGI